MFTFKITKEKLKYNVKKEQDNKHISFNDVPLVSVLDSWGCHNKLA